MLFDRGDMGDAGWGDRSATMRLCATAMAKSMDEDMGVLPFVGNHTTVLTMRSA